MRIDTGGRGPGRCSAGRRRWVRIRAHASARPATAHRASHLRHARAITRSRCSPSSLEGTPRALREARTTTRAPSGRSCDPFAHEVAQLPLDAIASVGALDFPLGYDETDEATVAFLVGSDVDDDQRIPCSRSLSDRGGEVRWVNHAVRARQHRGVSGGQLGAALAAAGSQNGAAGAGRHAQTEAVRLGTTTVVGLEGPLGGHGNSPRRGVVSHSVIGWAIDTRGAIAGTHARNGRKQRPRLSGLGPHVNAAALRHRVTHSIHSCANHCGSHPSTEGG